MALFNSEEIKKKLEETKIAAAKAKEERVKKRQAEKELMKTMTLDERIEYLNEQSIRLSQEIQEEKLQQKFSKPYQVSINYFGMHPSIPKECKVTFRMTEESICVDTLFKGTFEIKYNQINSCNMQLEEEVIQRFTATRIALFGPFALAMKKKKVNKTKYIVIECDDFVVTLDGDSKYSEDILQGINYHLRNYRENNPTQDSIQISVMTNDPYSEIKKAKELLDMGIITQEEFDIKKKQLLNL